MNGAADVPLNVVHDEAGCMSMAHVGRVARIEHDICDTYGARQARRHARAATISATAIGARGTMMRPCASHSMRLLRRKRQPSYRVLGSPEGVCEAEPSSSRTCQAYIRQQLPGLPTKLTAADIGARGLCSTCQISSENDLQTRSGSSPTPDESQKPQTKGPLQEALVGMHLWPLSAVSSVVQPRRAWVRRTRRVDKAHNAEPTCRSFHTYPRHHHVSDTPL